MCEINKDVVNRIIETINTQFNSQKEFAEKIELSPKVVSGWKKGVSKPTLEILAKISKATGQSIDWFVFGKEVIDEYEIIEYTRVIMLWCIGNKIEISNELINSMYRTFLREKRHGSNDTLEEFLQDKLEFLKSVKRL